MLYFPSNSPLRGALMPFLTTNVFLVIMPCDNVRKKKIFLKPPYTLR